MKNDKDKRLLNRAYKYLFGLTAFFFVTAVLGSIIGKQIDERFDVKPFGTLGSLVGFYAITWIISRVIVLRFNKDADKSINKHKQTKNN